MEDQITWQDLDSSFGRMFQELSQATEEKTSRPSSRRSSGSQSRKPRMCLCLSRAGRSTDASTMTWEDGALLGEFTMHSSGESPREENASLLLQILEDSPHPKYFLSEKACLGILTRAERRGKELPPELKEALLVQSRSKSEAENLGGKGILIQEERTGALSTLNNQSVLCLNDQGGSVMGVSKDVTGSLRAQEHGHQPVVRAGFDYQQGSKAGSIGYQEEQGPTLTGQKQMAVYDARGNGDGAIACTITGDHQNRVTDYTGIVTGFAQQGFGYYKAGEVASSLKRRDCKDATTLAVDVRNLNETEEPSGTLQSKNNGGYSLNYQDPVRIRKCVRRLTPLECERLQGYPDGWTDIGEWVDSKGKKHKESSDTARYKALGNSIALPFWFYLLRRISAQYERPAYLGSLFDGIGGFPLCWERCNGKGTALWASEIEEFPMAVTKCRFGEEVDSDASDK